MPRISEAWRHESYMRFLVQESLSKWGYTINSQPEVAGRHVDLVADRGTTHLVVECKAHDPRSHLTYDSLASVVQYANQYKERHVGDQVIPLVVGGFKVPAALAELAQENGVLIAPIAEPAPESVREGLTMVLKGISGLAEETK